MAAARILLRSDREAAVEACARGRRVRAAQNGCFEIFHGKGTGGSLRGRERLPRSHPPMMNPQPLTVTRQAWWPISRTTRAAARTHARLDNPFSISSYRPNCCEIAPGEGQRVLDSNPGERTAIFTSLTSPR